MKNQTFRWNVRIFALAMLMTAVTQLSAQNRRGVYGDWLVKSEFNGNQFESILSLSRNSEGNMTGSWISFFGLTELKNVKLEDDKLTFSRTFRGRDGESTSDFVGTIANRKLTGTTTSSRGESEVEGERVRRMSRAAGNWAMKIQAGEREYLGTLSISADQQGTLSGKWKNDRGESPVTDLNYSQGQLSFGRTIQTPDSEWDTKFEGTISRDGISGVFKSDRGDAQTSGELIGGSVIGTWDLEVDFDQGTRKQRLRVNPDMSALFGSNKIEKIRFEDNAVSFDIVLQFGDNSFEMDFKGKIDNDQLTGELNSSRGSQTVTGKKAVRRPTRRR